jgi:NhaP-type Na+/H+ and K+/H+ antiporter
VAGPSVALATVGVLVTAGVVAGGNDPMAVLLTVGFLAVAAGEVTAGDERAPVTVAGSIRPGARWPGGGTR